MWRGAWSLADAPRPEIEAADAADRLPGRSGRAGFAVGGAAPARLGPDDRSRDDGRG
jgi:hypothetical protein